MEKIPGVVEQGAGWKVSDEASRALYYEHFLTTQLAKPYMVGMHWFNYQDDAFLSTENPGGLRGIIDIDGNDYSELQASMRYMNDRIYDYIQFVDAQPDYDVTIVAEADAYYQDDQNYGAEPIIAVRESTNKLKWDGFVRFDTSQIQGEIASAKVQLFAVSPAEKLTGHHAVYLLADDSWEETSVIRANHPSDAELLLEYSHGDDLEIDVTAQVQAAVEGDNKISIGLMSTNRAAATAELVYASREHPDSYAHPKLVVYYQDSTANTTNYQSWIQSHTSVQDTGYLDDQDGDGIVNVMEYVLGLDAEATNVQPAVAMANDLLNREMAFMRNPDATDDTSQILQYTSDFVTWTDVPVTGSDMSSSVRVEPLTNGLEKVSLDTSTQIEDYSKLFYRLKVEDRR